ncbi:MAG: hypothetical protein LBS30_07125 [Planctomycetota bacterium]|jgi:4-hydroxybutyrate CoA-transferase|nr:hypothetical protein [Planctomycetota bacterium]
MPAITLAVKYCGGCNSSYDRPAMVERIRREFPGVSVANAESRDGEGSPDLVLVVCGCGCVCASHSHLDGMHGKVVVACEGDFARVREALAALARKQGTA